MKRRLAAILATDVVGFSRLMGLEEAGTLERLKRLRSAIVDPSIRERGGVLYLNPGSPTSPRMGTKPGVALLRVRGAEISAELVGI